MKGQDMMCMNKILFPILYAISMILFNILNWYGAKNTATLEGTVKYAVITLPIQLLAYIFLVQGLNIGYREYKSLYSLIILTVTIGWATKIGTAYAFESKLPSLGQGIALVLLIVANVVEKVMS